MYVQLLADPLWQWYAEGLHFQCKFLFFFPPPFLPMVSCLPSLLVGRVVLLTHTFSRVEVLWRSRVSPANLLWQIPFLSLWIQTSWRSIFNSHVKWHLEQCKNLKQELYNEPSQGVSSENFDLYVYYFMICITLWMQVKPRLVLTLFCLVLVLIVNLGLVTACEFVPGW